MTKLTTVDFTPPPDFPTAIYNQLHVYINKYMDTHKAQWFQFGMGWNGLAYRYRAAAEYDNEFTISIKQSGNSPPPEERYKQGTFLFGFFANAVSVIECFFFSAYFMASILKPNEFPFSESDELKNINPQYVASSFTQYFPKITLIHEMTKCIRADKYKQIYDMRNVLSHRGMLPRKFYRGGERDGMTTMPINPKDTSNNWQYDFPVDEQTTATYLHWLSDTLKLLVESSLDFCTQQLP